MTKVFSDIAELHQRISDLREQTGTTELLNLYDEITRLVRNHPDLLTNNDPYEGLIQDDQDRLCFHVHNNDKQIQVFLGAQRPGADKYNPWINAKYMAAIIPGKQPIEDRILVWDVEHMKKQYGTQHVGNIGFGTEGKDYFVITPAIKDHISKIPSYMTKTFELALKGFKQIYEKKI